MTYENSTSSEDPASFENAAPFEKKTPSENKTSSQGQVPVFLLSFVMAAFLGFQTWILISDQNALTQAYIQQGKTLEQIEKVKTQLGALAKGTMALAGQGNKNAQEIIDQLKKAGVNIQDHPEVPSATAPQKP